MSTSAPVKNAKTAGPAPLVPPEEQFWKRYSPHHEAPLSLAGSVAVHALAVGGMLLFAVYLAALFYRSNSSLPVEPVRMISGGSKKTGTTNNPGLGQGGEDVGSPSDHNIPGVEDAEAPKRPALNPVELKQVETKFDKDSFRFVVNSETGKALARMEDSIRDKLRAGLQPGSGSGGTGTGTGTGVGTGDGPGNTKLTIRERRMLRWRMRFTAMTGPEYLAQMRGLGAILAFPVTPGPNPQYKVVRDLRPGAPLKSEDLSRIKRIYWIDDKPNSVIEILQALRIPLLQPPPTRFVAFMPEKLEAKLFEMERNYVIKVLQQKFDEDRIDETEFRVVHTATGYKPELINVRMR